MSAAATPLRSPVTWFGGKGHLARHIVPLLPPHECYVEPFCGAGAVFFWKPRAPLETLNDLAGDVVQFYRVLRDPVAFERFRRLAELTPYAREEFEDCRRACHDDEDPVARAWAWFVSVRQAFGGATGPRRERRRAPAGAIVSGRGPQGPHTPREAGGTAPATPTERACPARCAST